MRTLLFLLFIFHVIFVNANFPVPTIYSVYPKTGFLIAHRPFMTHLVQENAYAFEITGWQQFSDTSAFTKRLKNPMKGYSVEFRNFGYNDVLGTAFSVTSYNVFPIYGSEKKFYVDLIVGTGIGYLTKSYDQIENPLNNAIGSKLNARVNLKLTATKYFNSFHLGGGIEFMHFSNGSIKTPNLGLNLPAVFLTAGIQSSERKYSAEKRKNFKRELLLKSNLSAEIILTAKEIGAVPFDPKLYPVIGGRFAYTYSKNGLWGFESAIDIIHNEANFHKYNDTTFVRNDILQIGIYVGSYIHFYKSQLAFGLGYYVRDIINAEGKVYNRIGYRYSFNKKWFGTFNIKANYAKADYFEFGIGYRFLKW